MAHVTNEDRLYIRIEQKITMSNQIVINGIVEYSYDSVYLGSFDYEDIHQMAIGEERDNALRIRAFRWILKRLLQQEAGTLDLIFPLCWSFTFKAPLSHAWIEEQIEAFKANPVEVF